MLKLLVGKKLSHNREKEAVVVAVGELKVMASGADDEEIKSFYC